MATFDACNDAHNARILPHATGNSTRAVVEPLWRHVLGDRLRRIRREQALTLEETARRAGVSPQYLSEVERGLKEPSSEMVAAISGALGLSLVDLVLDIAETLVAAEETPFAPRTQRRSEYLLAA